MPAHAGTGWTATWLLSGLPLVAVALAAAVSAFGVSGGSSRDSLVVRTPMRWTGWFSAKLALLPDVVEAEMGPTPPLLRLQQALALVMLAIPIAALIRRDWLLSALGLRLPRSLFLTLFGLGFGIRYFYPDRPRVGLGCPLSHRLWGGRSHCHRPRTLRE